MFSAPPNLGFCAILTDPMHIKKTSERALIEVEKGVNPIVLGGSEVTDMHG